MTAACIALLRELFVVASYFAIYLVVHYRSVAQLARGFFGGTRGDSGIYLFLLQYNIEEVLRIPSAGFDIGLFYPYGKALAYTDNFLLPALIGKFLLYLGYNFASTFNLLYVIASVLNGYCTYRLATQIIPNRTAAFYSGALFLLSSFLASHPGHPQLQFAFFIPLALSGMINFLETGKVLSAATVGLAMVGAFLSAVYYAIFIAFLCGVTFIAYFLLRPRDIFLKRLAVLVAANAPFIVLQILFISPYLAVREAFGARRLIEFEPFSATLLSYFAAPSSNRVWGVVLSGLTHYETYFFAGAVATLFSLIGMRAGILQGLAAFSTRLNGWLARIVSVLILSLVLLVALAHFAHLFPGYVPAIDAKPYVPLVVIPSWILCAVLATLLFLVGQAIPRPVLERDRRLGPDAQLLLLFLLAVFVFASFGIVGTVNEIRNQFPSLFTMLISFPLGFDSVRAAGRIGIVASLCITLLAGIGLARIQEGRLVRRRTQRAFALFAVALTASCIELRTDPIPVTPETPPPSAYEQLAQLSSDGAAIALPFLYIGDGGTEFAIAQTEYMRWLQVSHRPMVNGYSGKMPPYQQHLHLQTAGFPDEKSLRALGEIVGLRYIVFNPKYAAHFDRVAFEKSLEQFSDQLVLIMRDEAGSYLIELRPVLHFEKLELLVPPDTSRSRALSLELAREPLDPQGLPVVVKVRTGASRSLAGEKSGVFETILVDSSAGGSTRYTILLPPSYSPVRTHRVELIAEGLYGKDHLIARDIVVE